MQVGVLEARNRLSELLERAAAGEEVVITKHGRPYVEWRSARPTTADVERLLTRIRDRRRRMGLTLTNEEIKDAIEDGRL